MFNQTESTQANASNKLQHLAPDELLDILAVAKEHSVRDWCLILAGVTFGLRASEAVNIRLQDISWQAETLTVVRKKGSLTTTQAIRKHRGRPLMSMFHAFKECVKTRPVDGASDFIFVGQKGATSKGGLCPETATHLFYRYCKLASEKRAKAGKAPIARSCWNFKILKHTLGTCLANHGTNPYEIKMRLGHVSFSSTMVYLHGNQKLAAESTDKMMMELF
jgi:integrase